MKPTITLRLSPRGWIAHFNPPTDFGAALPTAFTEQAEPLLVLAEIERMNPEFDVKLGGQHGEVSSGSLRTV